MATENTKIDNEINERGYFWWSDQQVPEGAFAPSEGVHGLLTISRNGRVTLDLDGVLSGDPWAVFEQGETTKRNISGILKSDSRKVLLCNPWRNGGEIKSAGISHEKFAAEYCLVSRDKLPDINGMKSFYGMEIDLSSFQDWFGLGSIVVENTRTSTKVKYKSKKDLSYQIRDGRIEIKFGLARSGDGFSRSKEISLRETASIFCKLKFNSLKSFADEFQKLEDLFLILSGFETWFLWPNIFFNKNSSATKLYFQRRERTSEKVSLHQFWLRFPEISGQFQEILDAWREKREKFGPGLYMYLGTRRGLKSYVENNFANMAIGLEALHRASGINQANQNVQKKIDRIISEVTLSKDKRWLSKILKAEPSLKERMIDLFGTLPLPIPQEKLKEFSKGCANYRNDLSHFGTSRDQLPYNEFILILEKMSRALGVLYHFKILQEIRVPNHLLERIFNEGFQSFVLQMYLWEAGLLVEDPREAVKARAEEGRKKAEEALKKAAASANEK